MVYSLVLLFGKLSTKTFYSRAFLPSPCGKVVPRLQRGRFTNPTVAPLSTRTSVTVSTQKEHENSTTRIPSITTPSTNTDQSKGPNLSASKTRSSETESKNRTSEHDAKPLQTKEWTHENWREHPELNPTLEFPTWAVPLKHAFIIQTLISSEQTQPYLATRDEILQLCHPRPKIVQDGTDPKTKMYKHILLHPSVAQTSSSHEYLNNLPMEIQDLLKEHDVITDAPNMTIDIKYHQLPVNYILGKLLPEHVHPPPTAFETVGHVAHLNLRENHLPYAKIIGDVLLECLPNIETVIQKVGHVSGPYRTYDHEVLAGRNDTTVKLVEHGVRLEFDLSQVYWCSRLASERQVVLDQEIVPGQVIADAFCGVGAICLRAAQTKNCTILANDWNPSAVKYLKHNFALNGLDRFLALASNQDAYDFLMDLGLEKEENEDENEGKNAANIPRHVVDHVLMNFPLQAPTFLGALRWWSPPLSQKSPRLHVYTFARADPDTNRCAEDVAIDTIASELLPSMGVSEDEDGGDYFRKDELNDEYGCRVVAREIRDVAPGKLVFCVSFTATPKLLRHMQGDFD